MTTVTADRAQRPSSHTPGLDNETLLGWLRDMQLIREFESRTAQAYQQAKIGGFCHVYTGQEALVVGTFAAVRKDDPVVTAYRDHGHALARGMSPEACMAEMFGKISGCAKGKGGSMHMFDRPNELYGGHGIVGAQSGLGVGLAFSVKYEREVLKRDVYGNENPPKRVALCYLGDGALNQGCLHESMNLAGLFSLPVIYIVENNMYSMGTSIERGTTMAHDLTAKGRAYGMLSRKIDSMDILDIYEEFKAIADECREEQKPAFVDIRTYRYKGHSMSDPQKYRTREEVEKYEKEKDSIAMLVGHLMRDRKCLTEDEWTQMQDEIREQVLAAVKFAEEAPEPDPETELYSDVYVNPLPQMSPMRDYTHGARNPLLEGE
ncbi:MAG: pyruvate dehydrogenase (acetyl-transferring) E1 component subunit alpha [Phycisphaeraceae bacterium]|nr:pyruvate dehydrogenase (acetyl-transferring) E1 component subunit alpha [Phycisphaeraceae bacterium]